MVNKLVQKHLFKGTREFEIIGDTINVNIKSPFKDEESLTVMLTVLNPEPVISKSRLEFTSRVNNEPLLSFYLAKPNSEEFNAFINTLKQKAQDEFHDFAGMKSTTPVDLNGNVYEEPPEFDEPGSARGFNKDISAEGIEDAIQMLSEHVGKETIPAFIAALKTLQADPKNQSLMSAVVNEFDALGPAQGAVLTYAPYISILLSDDPFNDS